MFSKNTDNVKKNYNFSHLWQVNYLPYTMINVLLVPFFLISTKLHEVAIIIIYLRIRKLRDTAVSRLVQGHKIVNDKGFY